MKANSLDSKQNCNCQSSKDAWMCLLALIVCELLAVKLLHHARQNYEFWQWVQTLPGVYFTILIQASFFLGAAYYFSRAKTPAEFLGRVGYGTKIDLSGWSAACIAGTIAIIDAYGTRQGWTAASMGHAHSDVYSTGSGWFFYTLKSVLIVPFYEETVMRGFLYNAFRSRHGVVPSTGLIICLAVFFHWHSISISLYTTCCFVALWALLCVVKERTGSLWNCLLCHAVYNACCIELWLPTILSLIFILFKVIHKAKGQP